MITNVQVERRSFDYRLKKEEEEKVSRTKQIRGVCVCLRGNNSGHR